MFTPWRQENRRRGAGLDGQALENHMQWGDQITHRKTTGTRDRALLGCIGAMVSDTFVT